MRRSNSVEFAGLENMATATVTKQTEDTNVQIPKVSPRLVYWFDWYLQRYFPNNFHAFAVSEAARVHQVDDAKPLIVYLNHASWWDPLVALVLAKRFFPQRSLFAPIDEAALKKYPFMQRLGFFPVQQDSLHGAAQFLRAARAILRQPKSSVWLTPEGQFADPRSRTLEFQPGLAHLAYKLDEGILLPVAVEYPFWEERQPEVLVRFGEPIDVGDHRSADKNAWQNILQTGLRETQSKLEADSLARNTEAFEVLIAGRSGVFWLYDWMRRVRSWLTGEAMEKTHGEKLQ